MPHVRKCLHLDLNIYGRYLQHQQMTWITTCNSFSSLLKNRHNEAKEVFFDMYIPKEAFVSNFTMVIKGKTYQANVKTKEVAKQIYEDSTDTSGLLQTTTQPEFTDGKQVHT